MIAQDVLDYKAGMEADGLACTQYRLNSKEADQFLMELAETLPKKKAKPLLDVVSKGDSVKFINSSCLSLSGVLLRAVPNG